MQHLKTAPFPVSLRQSIRGVLTIDHIVGEAPFPCPGPCGGGLLGRAQFFPPYVLSESTKAVLTKCYMF